MGVQSAGCALHRCVASIHVLRHFVSILPTFTVYIAVSPALRLVKGEKREHNVGNGAPQSLEDTHRSCPVTPRTCKMLGGVG